ncbi:MAG: hypothetical protein WCI18_17385 [Pseudomonadota bacterium]
MSRQPVVGKGFGVGCLSYCTSEFQSLQTRYGAERVLLRNCNFGRASKAKERGGYKRNISNFLTELQHIRLACTKKKKSSSLKYELESIPPDLKDTAKILNISNQSIRPNLNSSDYT